MTKEQEEIAERLIERMKKESGSTDWRKFETLFKLERKDLSLVISALKELDFIAGIAPTNFSIRLTEKGWHFPGFVAQRHIEETARSTQSQINALTLQKLKFEQFPAKFWWLLIIISAFISVITSWVSNIIKG